MLISRSCLALALVAGLCTSASAQQSLPAGTPRQDLQQRWQSADTNHDGYIDAAEAKAGLPQVARDFDRLDANGDGKLASGELQQSMQATWAEADSNGDGLLDKAEAKKAGMTRVLRIFGRLDTNDDEKLSPEELQSMADRLRERRQR